MEKKEKALTVTDPKQPGEMQISRIDAPLPAIAPINIEALIVKSMDSGMAPETIQKFLDMRTQLKQEYAKEAYYLALAKFQSEAPTIKKTKGVTEKGSTVIRYRYATLDQIIEAVKKPLQANGFSYTNKTYQVPEKPGVMIVATEAHHAAGHTEVTTLEANIGKSGFMSAVQEIGSILSYLKRYTFCAAFGIMTGDEDVDGKDNKKTTPPAAAAAPVQTTKKEEKKPEPVAAKPATQPEIKKETKPEAEKAAPPAAKAKTGSEKLAFDQAVLALKNLYDAKTASGIVGTKDALLKFVLDSIAICDLKGKRLEDMGENQLWAVRAAAQNLMPK